MAKLKLKIGKIEVDIDGQRHEFPGFEVEQELPAKPQTFVERLRPCDLVCVGGDAGVVRTPLKDGRVGVEFPPMRGIIPIPAEDVMPYAAPAESEAGDE